MKNPAALPQSQSCPYCGAESPPYVVHFSRIYYTCPGCGLLFQNQNQDTNILSFYQQAYHNIYAHDQRDEKRHALYREVTDILERWLPGKGDLLDLGCGLGFFLKEAHRRGWNVSGVDPSVASIAEAQQHLGIAVRCGTIDDIPADARYNAITMINVLCHLPAPWQEYEKVMSHLAPGGLLYLRVPNGVFHGTIARLAWKLKLPKLSSLPVLHEYALTPRFFRRLLADTGTCAIVMRNASLVGSDVCGRSGYLLHLVGKCLVGITGPAFSMLRLLSGGAWIWGPSLEVLIRKES